MTLQGPHQSAKNLTITGCPHSSTSSTWSSVTSSLAPKRGPDRAGDGRILRSRALEVGRATKASVVTATKAQSAVAKERRMLLRKAWEIRCEY